MAEGFHGYSGGRGRGGRKHHHHGHRDRQYGYEADGNQGYSAGGNQGYAAGGNYGNQGHEAVGNYGSYDNTHLHRDQEQPIKQGHEYRRGGRGKRGRQNREDGEDNSSRERPPPGLKGRDIGMWYAARSKKNNQKKAEKIENRPAIQMDKNNQQNITKLLHTIRSGEDVPEQPHQSYKDPFDSDDESQPKRVKTPDFSDNISVDGLHNEDSVQQPVTPTSAKPFDFNSDFVSFSPEPSISTTTAVSKEPTCTVTRACDMLSSGQSSNQKQGESEKTVDAYYVKPQWMNNDDDSGDEQDLPDELAALLRKEAERPTDEADLDEPLAALYNDEDDLDSTFMTEFYQNKMANRRSCERLQDLGTRHEPLQRQPKLDKKLLDDKICKERNDEKYNRMFQFRKKLPSYNMQKEILRVINSSQVTVLSGETGCGKTTQVAQFILDDYIERGDGSLCHVACTQPRRISAITVAERVADERGERCGGASVGYQIRLEHKLPRTQGSILYCTTGIMLKWLVSDPWLSRTSHVILDEIHERDLHSDFLMIILKDLIKIRPDVKVILMSATLNAEMFSKYFGNCPMLNIPGFTFPVEEYQLEDVIEMTKYLHNEPPIPGRRRGFRGKNKYEQQIEENEKEEYIQSLHGRYTSATLKVLHGMDTTDIDLDLVASLVSHIHLQKQDGAILVFLPGWDQISKLNRLLSNNPRCSTSSCRIIPLHSLMPTTNQRQVFERPPRGIRKIVIATNIAETSITIDDVVYVIDCGKIKMKNFDPSNNITTLEPQWVSKANARQRRGRAGRVQPGECYFLYTALQATKFADYQLPEILRTRLEELCLQIKLLRLGQIENFVMKAMQTPSMESLHLAIDNLRNINALDSQEELTPLGYHLAKMPVDPHTGKMLLFAAMFCCLDPILTIAASLSFKDAFYIPLGKEKLADERRKKLANNTNSDHIMLANAYEGWEKAVSRGTAQQYCYQNFLSFNSLKMLQNMRKQFTELLMDMKFIDSANPKDLRTNKNSGNEKLLKAVICAGLYPNVAKMQSRRRRNSKAPVKLHSKTDNKIRFHPKSVNSGTTEFESCWFAYHLKMKTSCVFLYDCSMVSPYPLLFFGGAINIRKDQGVDCIAVDEWIVFRASSQIAHLVKELRKELDRLLENKIRHPGVTNWNPGDKEGALMHAILDLITTEDHGTSIV